MEEVEEKIKNQLEGNKSMSEDSNALPDLKEIESKLIQEEFNQNYINSNELKGRGRHR